MGSLMDALQFSGKPIFSNVKRIGNVRSRALFPGPPRTVDMAKSKRSNPPSDSDIKPPRMRGRWLWAGAFALVAILLALAIWDYDKDQAGLTRSVGGTVATAEKIIGRFGA